MGAINDTSTSSARYLPFAAPFRCPPLSVRLWVLGGYVDGLFQQVLLLLASSGVWPLGNGAGDERAGGRGSRAAVSRLWLQHVPCLPSPVCLQIQVTLPEPDPSCWGRGLQGPLLLARGSCYIFCGLPIPCSIIFLQNSNVPDAIVSFISRVWGVYAR